VPFTLADQVVTGDDYRKLIRRRKASQEKMTMCTPGLTAPLAARVKPPFSVRRTGKSTDDVSAAFVACGVTLPQPVSSPFLNPRFVFGDVLTGTSPSLAEIHCPLYCMYIQYKEVNLMPRRYEIDAAWRAAITREQDGRQTVTTAAFVRELHKFNWHWTPARLTSG
jgi:hypothetical protein